MVFFDLRAARVLAAILLFSVALAFVYLAWRTLVVFLFSILFAYLLEPLVSHLQESLRLSRGAAVALLYCVLTGVVGAFLILLGHSIVQQAGRLSQLVPRVSSGVTSGEVAHEIGNRRGWRPETQQRLVAFIAAHLIGFVAVRSPYVIALGAIADSLDFIPVIGPLAGFVVVAAAFLLTHSHFLLPISFLVCWRLLQDYFTVPSVLGGQVQLHPLAVILGVFAGARLAVSSACISPSGFSPRSA